MDDIVLSSESNSLSVCLEVVEKENLFNKQIVKTLRNKTYSKWSGSFKTFTLTFDKISVVDFKELQEMFCTPSSVGKVFSYRGTNYIVAITEDVLDFKEEYSNTYNQYLYSTTINLEEIDVL